MNSTYPPSNSIPYPIRSTPVPNDLLDRLPDLGNAELRVLLVVARQTLGWHDAATGRRKGADWLTQRQLLARTGCSRAPLSRAIDTLVQKQMIAVTTDTGVPLFTPGARQRHRGQLWFRLLEQAINGVSSETAQQSSEDEPSKLNTTKQSPNKKKYESNGRPIRCPLLSNSHSAVDKYVGLEQAELREALSIRLEMENAGKEWHWEKTEGRWIRRIDSTLNEIGKPKTY